MSKTGMFLAELGGDVAISAGSQLANDGEVKLDNLVADVLVSQTIGGATTSVLKSSSISTSKGKFLQSEVNKQKNAALGKSNTISKSRANVAGAQNTMANYIIGRGAAGGGAASQAGSKIYENLPVLPTGQQANNRSGNSGGPPMLKTPDDIQGN